MPAASSALAHLFPSEPLPPELAAATVVAISPDPAAGAVLGADLYDRTAWRPAYRAGARQGAERAEQVNTAWSNPGW